MSKASASHEVDIDGKGRGEVKNAIIMAWALGRISRHSAETLIRFFRLEDVVL